MDYKSGMYRPNRSAPAGEADSPALEPDLFKPHPSFSDVVNHNITMSEIAGGARLDFLPVGTVLEVETQHRYYNIEYRGDGNALICGHPQFCPRPTEVRITGSTWGGSMLWVRFIGRGMHLEFAHPLYGLITTSRIMEIRVLDADHPPAPRTHKVSSHPELN